MSGTSIGFIQIKKTLSKWGYLGFTVILLTACDQSLKPTKLFDDQFQERQQSSTGLPTENSMPVPTTTTTTLPQPNLSTPDISAPDISAPPTTANVSLAWEVNKTDRKAWTWTLMKYINEHWESLRRASDMNFFCPQYQFFNYEEQKIVWGELWVAVAYYESSYNPKSASVDVGTESNKDTWSVGLWQMSVVDQKNYKLDFGLKYDDLLTVDGNAKLSLAILARQIDKRGLIIVPSSPYWAVIYRGKYDKTDKIAAKVKSRLPACVK